MKENSSKEDSKKEDSKKEDAKKEDARRKNARNEDSKTGLRAGTKMSAFYWMFCLCATLCACSDSFPSFLKDGTHGGSEGTAAGGAEGGGQASTGSASIDAAAAKGRRPYVKPEGVSFHLKPILGARWTTFQGSEKETYLGARTGEEKLPGLRGRLFKYGQGELSVVQDEIYAVSYTFPRPVGRLEAIHTLGLSESLLAELREASAELTVERSPFGFRRFSLIRTEAGKDEYVRVMAWKFFPHEQRR